MKLFRLCSDQVQPQHPLPWNVYNDSSQLLLSRGYVLQDIAQVDALIARGVYVDQEAYAAHQRSEGQAARRQDAVVLWQSLHQRMAQLLTQPMEAAPFQVSMDEACSDIQHALVHCKEASLFELIHNDDPASYAVSHSVQTAFVASLIGQQMGLSEQDCNTLSQAALTMNVGMSQLQSTLALQLTPPSPQQRQAIQDHGAVSRRALEALGVTDTDWLRAVEHHHITPDGGPLPARHAELGEIACMLHYTDVYLAKISARASRPAMPSHTAARSLFVQADGARNPYVAALIKEIGMYPPGSSVRLANGEIGIVVRRGESAHLPEVHSLIDSQGQPMPQPKPRNTAEPTFKVTEALPRGRLSQRLNRRALFDQTVAA
jgi:HD-GYP domain-containing protein (c-di-GMP phosphodiesterase class II)